MKLYGFWRSSATWRARIALNLKGVAYDYVPVHLVEGGGQQHAPTFKTKNPMAQVPVLELPDGRVLSQSLAIIQWLEAHQPKPALLPRDPYEAARVWQAAELVNSGIQPLVNLTVMNALKERGVDENGWAQQFMAKGLLALEEMLAPGSGRFAFGDAPTVADICLVPQLYGARRYHVDLARMPTLLRIEAECEKLPAFAKAHPDVQPDAPK